jgi:hypothetical protein
MLSGTCYTIQATEYVSYQAIRFYTQALNIILPSGVLLVDCVEQNGNVERFTCNVDPGENAVEFNVVLFDGVDYPGKVDGTYVLAFYISDVGRCYEVVCRGSLQWNLVAIKGVEYRIPPAGPPFEGVAVTVTYLNVPKP